MCTFEMHADVHTCTQHPRVCMYVCMYVCMHAHRYAYKDIFTVSFMHTHNFSHRLKQPYCAEHGLILILYLPGVRMFCLSIRVCVFVCVCVCVCIYLRVPVTRVCASVYTGVRMCMHACMYTLYHDTYVQSPWWIQQMLENRYKGASVVCSK